MSVKMDKIGTTFYGDSEVKTAREFRQLVAKEGFSINHKLKMMVAQYVKKFGKVFINGSPTTK